MLSKLVINDWVHVSSGLALKHRGRMLKWNIPVSGFFCWEVGSNAENRVTITLKEEFLYK